MWHRWWIISALRIAAGLALVAAITAVAYRALSVNATTAGFAFLLGVLAVATSWGLTVATITSFAAMLCFNYFFLPPVGRFTIADPQNWVALFSFLVTALVASHLSDRARHKTDEAETRRRETEQLYALSRAILLTDPAQPLGRQAVAQIAQIFDCDSVVLYSAESGEVFRGGPVDVVFDEQILRQAVMLGVGATDPPTGVYVAPIALGGQPIGSLALAGVALSDGALQALLNLVAIALERVRTQETASRAEVARRAEEFKSTLLDAIAHEFKTPLTSIRAAATGMLAEPAGLKPEALELAAIIDEEATRLSQLVSEAVRMAQIDAGKLRLERHAITLAEVIALALSHYPAAKEEGRFRLEGADAAGVRLRADPELLALALRQLIDNSLKYAPPDSPVVLTTAVLEQRVELRVNDRGPGIPEQEFEHIFDRYYRREGTRKQVSGFGMGLHIAREILRAHGGDLTAEPTTAGAQLCLALPRDEKEGQ